MVEIIVPVSFFAAVVVAIYISLSTRNKERLAMIEKGVDPSVFQNKSSGRLNALKWGMFTLGAGIGALVGSLLKDAVGPIAIPGMIAIGAGLMLIIFYVLTKGLDKE